MLNKLFSKRSSSRPLNPVEKLEGYLDLAKDIVERGIKAESERQKARASSFYTHALGVISEGLQIDLPVSGLGLKADTVASLRQELLKLHDSVSTRLSNFASPNAQPVVTQQAQLSQKRNLTVKRQKRAAPSERSLPTSNVTTAVVDGMKKVGKVAKDVIAGEAARHREQIMGEILVTKPGIAWDDIAGLPVAKQALHESVILPSLRPDLFQGLRSPPKGLLLYGPPGNGKTMLAKALASQANASFFNISASSLTSKWVGEGEKLVRALFEVAAEMAPSIIFIDEIDSILSARSSNEHEASRKLKTEFLVQFDGLGSSEKRIVVIGATNRPHELDDAALRRLVKRIYIPLPDTETRKAIIVNLFKEQKTNLTSYQLRRLVDQTEGYSASDLTALCKEASMVAIRELGSRITTVSEKQLRPVTADDFNQALTVIRPSVNQSLLETYNEFTKDFGSR